MLGIYSRTRHSFTLDLRTTQALWKSFSDSLMKWEVNTTIVFFCYGTMPKVNCLNRKEAIYIDKHYARPWVHCFVQKHEFGYINPPSLTLTRGSVQSQCLFRTTLSKFKPCKQWLLLCKRFVLHIVPPHISSHFFVLGIVLPRNTRKIPDYGVVPIMGAQVDTTVGEVVTNAWVVRILY